ncbi:MAG: hypothetical protein M3123_01280, partial [Actinomycetota bacterium]|nr:hypothetical protein [Actinomycetota bacterium]
GGGDVAEGRYRLVAVVTSGGQRASRTASVVVDRTLGAFVARPTPFSPNGDARRDTLFLRFQLARAAAVRVQIVHGSRTVATLLSGTFTAGPRALSWNGRAGGAALADGRYRAVVGATTELGTRRLGGEVVLDTRKPRLSQLSASRSAGGTLVRLRLSEPALLVVRIGTRTFTAKGQAGAVRVWRPALAGRVEVVASDAAGNTSPPLVVSVAG